MKCTHCAKATRVIDSRDDSSPRNEWLIRHGAKVFGWWTRDFRLRRRKCVVCELVETTIEITLDDLEDAISDLRDQAFALANKKRPRVLPGESVEISS